MLQRFIPTFHAYNIFLIDYNKLKQLNLIHLFFDLDNTLSAYYAKTPNEQVITFIKKLKMKGFHVYVISNNHEERVAPFVEPLQVEYIFETKKPSIRKIRKFIEQKNLNFSQCILIGDQIFTDVLCANRLGISSILVEPFVTKDLPITRFNRFFDRRLRRIFKKKNYLCSIERSKEIND